MQKKIIKIVLLTLFVLGFLQSCIPDRMPTEPVENKRPKFVKFDTLGNSNLVVPLNQPVKMFFNEKMDLKTFPSNIVVSSVRGEIKGTFSYAPESDTIVVFTPSGNYNKAEIYTVYVHGGVRDIHGNSMISPNDEDVPQTFWFFTQGDYSEGGFPLVFSRDKAEKQVLYRAGNLNRYLDSLYVSATVEDYQTAALEFSPRGNYMWMVNLKTTDGTVTLIDPENFQVSRVIDVGYGPTNVGFSSDKAYVTNKSGKSFTAIDLNSYAAESTFDFTDNFKPYDVVYSQLTDKLYFISSSNKDIKVVNAQDYNDNQILDTVLTDNKGIDIEITDDGEFIFIPEKRTDKIVVFNTQNSSVVTTIETGYSYIGDGVINGNYYYASFYKYSGSDTDGGIVKINASTQSIENVFLFGNEIDKLGITNSGELLYAVTPSDSSLHIVETETMKEISNVKINGSLKYIAVSKNNY